MINAIVTAVIPRSDGSGDFAFAKSQALVSHENPDGSALFYLKPPFWARTDRPAVGQAIVIGEVKRVMKPDWQHPRWRAFGVSPAPGSSHGVRPQLAPAAPVVRRQPAGWWSRVCGALGLTQVSVTRATTN